MLRWVTTGESYRPALVVVIEGIPAGLELQTSDFERALWRRRLGHGQGTRQEFEKDRVRILGGVCHGLTFGAPIAIGITNSEWPRWEAAMSADPMDPQALLIDAGSRDEREITHNKPLTRPRPRYTDLVGMLSYELEGARPVPEHASAGKIAARVALRAVAEAILSQVGGVQLLGHVIQVGNLRAEEPIQPMPGDEEALSASAMRTLDVDFDQRFRELVNHTKTNGDTIGGIVEVIAWGVPVGLESHVSARTRLDTKIAHALMPIQSVRGVEVDDDFAQAAMLGSEAHDEILKGPDGHLLRVSNRADGIGSGTSNGQSVVMRTAFKAISTVPRTLRSAGLVSEEEALGLHQRSDTCQLVPGVLTARVELALVLADVLFEHVGRKSVAEMRHNLEAYRQRVGERT